MAFLVCYSKSASGDDHPGDRAIYLDQRFYELIYTSCRTEHGLYSVLREIASLKYKSPTLVISDHTSDIDARSKRLVYGTRMRRIQRIIADKNRKRSVSIR
jgi:hypothetical protein